MQYPGILSSQKTCSPYQFSIKVATQVVDKKLLIEQSSEGLKISIQSGGNNGQMTIIPKYMIVGLPKIEPVPKRFFDSISARLVDLDSGSKVYFNGSLKGGGLSDALLTLSFIAPELYQLLYPCNQYMENIRIYINESVRNYNSIPGINDILWNEKWYNLNIQLAKLLDCPLSISEKKQDIFKNIQDRINFCKEKRQILSQHQLVIADSIVRIRASINEIETNRGYIQNVFNQAQLYENEMCTPNPFGFKGCYNPVLPVFVQELNNCLVSFDEINLKANQMKEMETEVYRRMSECDTEIFRLEKLFLAMKINQMRLDEMITIDAPSIRRALENGEKINFPGANGIGNYLD